jgi:hypothetical protein
MGATVEASQRGWHRLFGMSLTDLFYGLPVVVELEKDLSLKQQLLDVVVLRRELGPLPVDLPDGFENLSRHNLISFKSHQESLDGWTLDELIGHYVNYRKQVSPDWDHLLPENDFRLYAVCIRTPRNLLQAHPLQELRPGVYEGRSYTQPIRIVVVHELPQAAPNALLHLFSARQEAIEFGRTYRLRSKQTSTFIYQLYEQYLEEGIPMPYTAEQFIQETLAKMRKDPVVRKFFAEDLTVEERLEGIPPEQRLEGIPPEQLLAALSPEVREVLLRQLREETPQGDAS